MESANIPHHHHHHHHHYQHHTLQDQLIVDSSTTTTTLDLSGYAAASAPAWTPNTILNNGGFNSDANVAILSSRNPRLQHDLLVPSLHDSMTQDFSFDWANNTSGNNFINQSSHDYSLQLARIKRELSDSYTHFSEVISSPLSSVEDLQVQMQPTRYRKNEQRDINDPYIKLLRRKLSSGSQNNGLQYCPEESYCSTSSTSTPAATTRRGTFSQIHPTINVSSNFNQVSLANSSSFDMNLQALDLLNSAGFNGSFRQSMQDQLGLPKNGLSYGYDYVKQSIQMPIEPSKITPFSNGVAEAKSSNINLEPKTTKRSRVESRASCPPFKVRKEKLGDRIAALQQLVAPFGKTDTASVLMEAIGYIKFLQNQVETLSVPYLKSSRNKPAGRAAHGGNVENGSEEKRRDLRSRGLCLVPMSCLSYVTDSGGSIWPPPTFGGGT